MGATVPHSPGGAVGESIIAIRDHWHTMKHPFFQLLAKGELPLRALGLYMALHHKFVATAVPSMGIIAYRAPPDARLLQIENLAEEAGVVAGGEREAHDHNEMIFDFCGAVGMSREEVESVDIPPAWWARLLHYLRTANEAPVGAILAMQSTQEGQQVDLFREIAIPALTSHYGFARNASEIEFFVEHEVADTEHAGRQLALCEKYLQTDELIATALEICEQACKLRWASITDIYRAEVLGDKDPMPA